MTEIGRVNKHKTTHQDAGADEIDATGLTRSPVFVDRGDAAALDFTLEDFITNATWIDIDLSSIVPIGALSVLINVYLLDDAANSLFRLRKDGNINESAVSKARTQVANVANDQNYIVPLPSTRIIEYNATNTTWTSIGLCILGWWI